jgi:hypothetical protein
MTALLEEHGRAGFAAAYFAAVGHPDVAKYLSDQLVEAKVA